MPLPTNPRLRGPYGKAQSLQLAFQLSGERLPSLPAFGIQKGQYARELFLKLFFPFLHLPDVERAGVKKRKVVLNFFPEGKDFRKRPMKLAA